MTRYSDQERLRAQMSEAHIESAPRASGSASGGVGGVGGPNGTPEAELSTTKAEIPTPTGAPRGKAAARPGGDRIFKSLATTSAIFISILIAAIGIFLIWRAVPALSRNQVNFLTSREWVTQNINAMAFGVLDLFQVTVLVSLFALILAMPVALGIAIFLTEYSPNWLKRPLAYVIDLLAAVPSIVYGLWGGLLVFAPAIKPLAVWLNEKLGWFPLFATGSGSITGGGTIFTAGIVLAVMILPVITAVTREVFVQTPTSHIELRSHWAPPGGKWCEPRSFRSASPVTSADQCSAWVAPSARPWRST